MKMHFVKMARLLTLWAGLAFGLPAFAQTGAEGGILGEEAVEKAEPGVLQAEVALFDTIRKGITLSIAQCEPDQSCAGSVNREELRRILDAVEKRIDLLTNRHTQTGDAALEPVLLAYADVRDNYSKVLEQLGAILPEEEAEEEGLIGEEAGAAAGLPPEFNVFEDAGEDLIDDEDLDLGDLEEEDL